MQPFPNCIAKQVEKTFIPIIIKKKNKFVRLKA